MFEPGAALCAIKAQVEAAERSQRPEINDKRRGNAESNHVRERVELVGIRNPTICEMDGMDLQACQAKLVVTHLE